MWLCNIVLPSAAEHLNLKASHKEGWLSGICDVVKENHEFELGIAFPVPMDRDGVSFEKEGITFFGFYEDTVHPEIYDNTLEGRLKQILDEFKPDMVHIFGTEYPHTLAMCRCMADRPDKILVGIQGVLEIYKNHYFDGLPGRVINRVTFRDFVRRDSLRAQQKKYALRAVNEVAAVKIAGHITGRTPFDLEFAANAHHEAKYHFMNETLRPEFYEGAWDIDECIPHTIFLSQGNYPIKGLHIMLKAAGILKEKYSDIKIFVAGDRIAAHKTLKDKLKLSSYGKYIIELLKEYKLTDAVTFTGSLNAEGIKEQLLKCSVFVCPSSIENSPNSLGEAMLLGVPCIASEVGGIPGIFKKDTDGLTFKNGDYEGLAECIDKMWSDEEKALSFSEKASMHAHITHNPELNYKRLLEIYREIVECK
ncbi:MAG: glycosyltransferase family 4 protein [Lachnospiraceae bacterium]|nr:glycosyltransferase family 4 protein [Lachnospiraceae bacterium]